LCFSADVDAALGSFKELEALDPFRLENMDTLSNLLYVKEMRYELANLAHRLSDIDKYRVETCCVIGGLALLIVCQLYEHITVDSL